MPVGVGSEWIAQNLVTGQSSGRRHQRVADALEECSEQYGRTPRFDPSLSVDRYAGLMAEIERLQKEADDLKRQMIEYAEAVTDGGPVHIEGWSSSATVYWQDRAVTDWKSAIEKLADRFGLGGEAVSLATLESTTVRERIPSLKLKRKGR